MIISCPPESRRLATPAVGTGGGFYHAVAGGELYTAHIFVGNIPICKNSSTKLIVLVRCKMFSHLGNIYGQSFSVKRDIDYLVYTLWLHIFKILLKEHV